MLLGSAVSAHPLRRETDFATSSMFTLTHGVRRRVEK
jgi:hypothetical protein